MGQKLTKMEINRVDLVDAGANGRQFAIFKRADAAPLSNVAEAWVKGLQKGLSDATPEPSLLERIGGAVAKALGFGPDGSPIAKAATFAEQIAAQEMTSALEDNFWVLSSALWAAMYAVDDNGADLSMAAKQALVAQNLDEFKAYLIGVMDAGIGKRASTPTPSSMLDSLVAKVGRKITAARLSRLKDAASALTDVLNEVDAADAATEKRADAQEDDPMTPEELTAAIAKGNEPLIARVEALEKAPVAVLKTTDEGEPADGPITLDGIAKAVGDIADRIETIEKAAASKPGQRTSADGQDGGPVRKSAWAGVF